MHDLLTPAELAAIAEREAKAMPGPWYWRCGAKHPTTLYGSRTNIVMDVTGMRGATFRFFVNGLMHKASRFFTPRKGQEHNASFMSDLDHPDAQFIAHARADIPTLLRHIAALEARTPAPALPADMETLLADAGYKAVLAALRQEAVDKCAGGFGAPDLDADYQLSLSLLVREVYQILNIEQHIDALATALRESRAREVAEPYRHALEQRLICSNLPLLTGDADADLMRFVFHEQEVAGYFCGQLEKDLDAAIARAEKVEAENRNLSHSLDCQGQLHKDERNALAADLAAARAELGALKEAQRRSDEGEWKCDRCEQWKPMDVLNVGIECDMCEACADEVGVLEGGAQ